jgi:hypothetical protein
MVRHANRTRVFALGLAVLPGLGFVHTGAAFAASPVFGAQNPLPAREGKTGVESQNRGQAQDMNSRDSQNRKMTQETAPNGDNATGGQTGERHHQHHQQQGQAQGEHSYAKESAETMKKGENAGGGDSRY